MPPTLHPSLPPALAFCGLMTAGTFIAGELTNNLSQVDRLWTFLPVVYTAWFTFWPVIQGTGEVHPRAAMMLGLQTMWMLRLSYNTYRRGLFSLKEEDYRWAVFRHNRPKFLVTLFNLSFVALTQNVLLLGLGIPAHLTLLAAPTPLNTTDVLLAALALLTLGVQFTADNQQFAYQSCKHEGKSTADAWPGAKLDVTEADKKRGFISKGLWAWSRHPNFACEQTFWLLQNLIPVLSTPRLTRLPLPSPTPITLMIPSLALSFLFLASTRFTEFISLRHYPVTYAAYKQRVGMFSPITTLLKGFVLAWRGRDKAVEELVWGSGEVKKDN